MSAPLLQVSELFVRAGGVELVRGVSFAVAAGERVGLIGASGSGKTMTCLAVAGLLPSGLRMEGSVRLEGTSFDLASARESGSSISSAAPFFLRRRRPVSRCS